MRYFFIVQGEGRGHMTQAIALSQILSEAGHEVVQVVVGKSPQRTIPSFFHQKINAPVSELSSPNFATDKEHKSVKPVRTIIQSALKSPVYFKSIKKISELVKSSKPDVIINFYDFLGGLYNYIHKPRIKFICIAHQYLLGHPDFSFPQGRKLDKATLKIGNSITQLGADKLLALSFQHFPDYREGNLYVVPPLLRQEVKTLQKENKEQILVYMVNPGYGKEVENFHKKYSSQPLVCFWDKKDKPEDWRIDDTLSFHQLNDTNFLQYMAKCKGYVSTAGFESICEAMYLGKPVMMVPVEGHYEQSCNAVDAVKAGAGIQSNTFDIKKLVDFIPKYIDTSTWFKKWADSNVEAFLKHLV